MSGKTWGDLGVSIPHGQSGEIDAECPWCSGLRKKKHAKCLSINTDTGMYFCHHCGVSGSLQDGERTKSDDPFGAAYGAPLRTKVYQAPRPLPAVVAPTTWDKAVTWFAGRGIPESVLVRNGIITADEWCPVCEAKVGHLLFPYHRGTDHVNTKHRCGAKHFRMEKGAERIFYGLNDISGDTLVIVEGEIDKLSCEVAGFRNCLSVPDGAPSVGAANYSSKFAFLQSAEALIGTMKTVILACDADDPGQVLTEELARRIGHEKCRRVIWPDGIKDANECLVNTSAAELRRCLEEAEPFPIEGLIHIRDLRRDIDELYERGTDPGVGAGWFRFDRHYRVRPGLMTILTGIPSHGKSRWLDHFMVRLADLHGWSFAVCSPEQLPLRNHAVDIFAAKVGKPFHAGKIERMTPREKDDAADWVEEHFSFILPEKPDLDTILDRARIAVYQDGVRGIVIDPWTEIEAFPAPGMSSVDHINQCLSKMRRFATHYNVHLWLVAHPTKVHPEHRGDEEPVPSLYDISGGAHFRNKADYGLVVWRDINDLARPVQVHIKKVRFDETGEPGMVEFFYDPPTRRYREA